MSSATSKPKTLFWPHGARLVVSVSMQFEAGAQPDRGAESPFPPIDANYPDLPVMKWYEYGFKEGIPRLLDLFDRRKVKVTSHMVGAAVERICNSPKKSSREAMKPPGMARLGRRSIP